MDNSKIQKELNITIPTLDEAFQEIKRQLNL